MFRELPHHAELFIAAHSFGTDILTHWLRGYVLEVRHSRHVFRLGQRIHGIVLISGIAKRKYVTDIREACNVLVNDVAVGDRVPSWAAGLVGWAYDDIGTRGILTGAARPIDRYFDGGHGALISVSHFRDNILPIVLGEPPPPGRHRGPKVSTRYLSRVQALRNLLLFLLVGGMALWSSWSPSAKDASRRCLRPDAGPCKVFGPPGGRAQEDTAGGRVGGVARPHVADKRGRSCHDAGPPVHGACSDRAVDRPGTHGTWPDRSSRRGIGREQVRFPPPRPNDSAPSFGKQPGD
jgi:hypothetical protein